MPSNTLDSASSLMEEEFNQWLQWMKATPSPLILNLTTHIHDLVLQNRWVSEEHLKFIDTSLEQYISRIGCRVILLPSMELYFSMPKQFLIEIKSDDHNRGGHPPPRAAS